MGLEATSWGWLRDGVRKTLPAFSIMERVENGVLAGMADVNYVIRGVEGWIELKAVDLPKRDGTPVLGPKDGLSTAQKNWHMQRIGMCGKTFIFISADPYRWLVGGVWADQVNNWDRERLCDSSLMWYDENWTEFQWKALIRHLAFEMVSTRNVTA